MKKDPMKDPQIRQNPNKYQMKDPMSDPTKDPMEDHKFIPPTIT